MNWCHGIKLTFCDTFLLTLSRARNCSEPLIHVRVLHTEVLAIVLRCVFDCITSICSCLVAPSSCDESRYISVSVGRRVSNRTTHMQSIRTFTCVQLMCNSVTRCSKTRRSVCFPRRYPPLWTRGLQRHLFVAKLLVTANIREQNCR